MNSELINAISLVVLSFQGVATLILLSRLLPGAMRRSPLQPQPFHSHYSGKVSAIIPTLNEAERIKPCLQGLSSQGDELREIIVVDSYSQDETPAIVKAKTEEDHRFRLINDPPLPKGWVGRPWALHNGFLNSSHQSEWILGIDADTLPQAGLINSLITTAETEGYDLISLAPQFILQFPGEWWLQPALLVTLLYRFNSAGVDTNNSERVMANGQCFFCRREVLQTISGYSSAADSFCDDVTLARNIAAAGYQVGFIDGSKLIKVRMYEGAKETWQEWGRSLDLKDAASVLQVWSDWWFLLLVQGLPLPLSLIALLLLNLGYGSTTLIALLGLNLFLLFLRLIILVAIASCYQRPSKFSPASWLFWFSPLADPLAVVRIFLSSRRTPTQWRGRIYAD
ncbi:glycosyl transferase family 2 [Stanieria cyanosphaera PCC 7437]|uniref:4,4'-diaponeurosporenoate glycosyltransferase n=1 Tax=Stanieria cyanosphaera (strain ATCC 29371 / PCC 7437) TaxID=111780 RepID=K9XVZ0_STAC7|nr:glycosyltransferase family 2 protein [Stanieria cyanosphaera]AFZ35837.1 glycosyl transferase family 2 [Stanieria cyanosphaera PCC 7437]